MTTASLSYTCPDARMSYFNRSMALFAACKIQAEGKGRAGCAFNRRTLALEGGRKQ